VDSPRWQGLARPRAASPPPWQPRQDAGHTRCSGPGGNPSRWPCCCHHATLGVVSATVVRADGKTYPEGGHLPPADRGRTIRLVYSLVHSDKLSISEAQRVMLDQHGVRRSLASSPATSPTTRALCAPSTGDDTRLCGSIAPVPPRWRRTNSGALSAGGQALHEPSAAVPRAFPSRSSPQVTGVPADTVSAVHS
jgi:hypothetical protein